MGEEGSDTGKRAKKGREVGGYKQMLGRGVPQQQILTTYCNETATSPTVVRLPCHLLWRDGHFIYCGEMVTCPEGAFRQNLSPVWLPPQDWEDLTNG